MMDLPLVDKHYICYVDLRTQDVHTMQDLETSCGLTHVHTRFSQIRKSQFSQKGSILVFGVICRKME